MVAGATALNQLRESRTILATPHERVGAAADLVRIRRTAITQGEITKKDG